MRLRGYMLLSEHVEHYSNESPNDGSDESVHKNAWSIVVVEEGKKCASNSEEDNHRKFYMRIERGCSNISFVDVVVSFSIVKHGYSPCVSRTIRDF